MIDCGYLVGLARQSRKQLAFLLAYCLSWPCSGTTVVLSCLKCVVVLLQDEVLIAGFGRRGHAVGDIPGVRFKV